MDEYLCDLGVEKDFLKKTPSTQIIKKDEPGAVADTCNPNTLGG